MYILISSDVGDVVSGNLIYRVYLLLLSESGCLSTVGFVLISHTGSIDSSTFNLCFLEWLWSWIQSYGKYDIIEDMYFYISA